MGKIDAFILLGGFGILCRNPLYVEDLRRRELAVLLIAPDEWRDSTLVAMRDPDHPGAGIDEAAFVSGSLGIEGSYLAGVVATVRRWQDEYRILGAYAMGESLVEPTGVLSDVLGVPSPGLRATRACRSKYLQRWYLPEYSPVATVLPAGQRRELGPDAVRLPAIVKPAGRHSSSGVEFVVTGEELAALLASYPTTETVLVEHKISGPEFSVESLVQRGEIVFASVTRKETTETTSRAFVELSHTVPNQASSENEKLLDANYRMLQRLGFENGIAHAEWRLGNDGEVYLMEVAARTPGDGLLPLYHLSTGVPLEPEIIKVALGEPASYPAPRRVARQVYLEHPPGVLQDVVVDWPGVEPVWIGATGVWPDLKPSARDDPPALRCVLVFKERGAELGPLRESDDRAVAFVIDAPSHAELDDLERRVRRAVDVRVAP